MNEAELKSGLQKAWKRAEGTPPAFDETWAAAEARHAKSGFRRTALAGVAAAAALAVVIVLLPEQQVELTDEFLIADALMNSTSWTAPSDVLMPEHQFDIYREIPIPDPSTIAEEGSLL